MAVEVDPVHRDRLRITLEERLGITVRAFAYVNGSPATYNSDIVSAVERAGYQIAFATHSGPVPLDHLDEPFTIRRYNVEPVSHYTFQRLLEGDCDLIAWKDSKAGLAGKQLLDRLLGTG